MKPAKGKHGSAMATNAAKKIQRRNMRREKNKFIQEEAASSGLGPLQIEHFRSMSSIELKIARIESKEELSRLGIYPESPAKRDKIKRHELVVDYIDKLLKEPQ